MKYTIEGYSQERAVELGLAAEDLVILRWFADFWPSPAMAKMERDGRTWAHVIYDGFARQMPIIGGNKRTLARKFQRLVDAGVLDNMTVREGGCYSVYAFGPEYQSLVDNAQTCDKKTAPYVEKSTEGMSKNEQTSVEESTEGMSKNRRTNIVTNLSELVYQTSQSRETRKNFKKISLPPDEYEKQILDIYNATCTGLRKCQKLTLERRIAISALREEGTSIEDWQTVCDAAQASTFLTGQNRRGWKANFDFLLDADKRTRLMEGHYEDDYPGYKPTNTRPALTPTADAIADAMDRYLRGD